MGQSIKASTEIRGSGISPAAPAALLPQPAMLSSSLIRLPSSPFICRSVLLALPPRLFARRCPLSSFANIRCRAGFAAILILSMHILRQQLPASEFATRLPAAFPPRAAEAFPLSGCRPPLFSERALAQGSILKVFSFSRAAAAGRRFCLPLYRLQPPPLHAREAAQASSLFPPPSSSRRLRGLARYFSRRQMAAAADYAARGVACPPSSVRHAWRALAVFAERLSSFAFRVMLFPFSSSARRASRLPSARSFSMYACLPAQQRVQRAQRRACPPCAVVVCV